MLADDIATILAKISSEGKKYLHAAIQDHWHLPIKEYSAQLWSYEPSRPMEPELAQAFDEELEYMGYSSDERTRIIDSLKRRRILQTAPHTRIAPAGRMLCIDWFALSGKPKDDFYVIGTFSGVPFSNKSRPGRFESESGQWNTIPKTHQDALVYGSPIFAKTLETVSSLPPAEKQWVEMPQSEEGYSDWAIRNSNAIERHIFGIDAIVTLDINKVISRYLALVIPQPDHLVTRLLFDAGMHQKFLDTFGEGINLFYSPYDSKKYEKQENLFLDGYSLKGNNITEQLSVDSILEALQDRRLCPATIVTFTVLSFLNHFACMGSFVQVEYLSHFKEKWQAIGIIPDIDKVPTTFLTTGMFPGNPELRSLDIAMGNAHFPDPNQYVYGDILAPIWQENHDYGSTSLDILKKNVVQ